MQRKLRIYYTSDTHGFFSPIDYATGGSVDSGLANCMSNFQHSGNTLVIDGGDTLQGSPFTYWLYSQHRDGDCVPARLLNLGGYDFITLGNHDFNYGKAEIERFLDALGAKCLCANVEGIRGVEKTAVITLENGLRIGLTGIVTHYVNHWETPDNLFGIKIGDTFSAAKSALDELKAQNVDLTVCIYHGGFENDIATGKLLSATGENQGWRICQELDFDVLLCAHQHIPVENLCVNGTYTCQPPDKARQYITMDVTVDDRGKVSARSRLCDAGCAPLPAAMEYLAPLERETAQWLDTPVGHLDTPLLPEPPLEMAAHGSLIANFFNQVQLEASGADISSTSLANTVKGFEQDVTIRDVVSTYIFPNTLVTLRVDRRVLKSALERCAEYFTLGKDGLEVSETFLHPIAQHFNYDYFAGVSAVFDLRRPVGERVVSIKCRGAELAEDKSLTLCMNNYRASGAGGYEVYRECDVVREQPTEISELIIEYIDRHRNITVDKTKWLEIVQ